MNDFEQQELFQHPEQVNWHEDLRASFDLETTSPDPAEARIVTASLIIVDGQGNMANHQEWLVNPGIDIPTEAAAIHGISTEMARKDGLPAVLAVSQIATQLNQLFEAGIPVIAFNACYDFTVMAYEAKRHHVVYSAPKPVIDPYVLDKAMDRYRRGKRTLTEVSAFYQVPLQHAHTSAGDALAAAGVADQLARKFRQLQVHPDRLHDLQVEWRAEQAKSLEDFLRRKNPEAHVDPRWPVAYDGS